MQKQRKKYLKKKLKKLMGASVIDFKGKDTPEIIKDIDRAVAKTLVGRIRLLDIYHDIRKSISKETKEILTKHTKAEKETLDFDDWYSHNFYVEIFEYINLKIELGQDKDKVLAGILKTHYVFRELARDQNL